MNIAYNTDCMEAMRQMPDKCFDLAVVDPPYGISINNNMGRRKGDKPATTKKLTGMMRRPKMNTLNSFFEYQKIKSFGVQIIFDAPPQRVLSFGENRKLASKCRFLCWNMHGQVLTLQQKSGLE